MLVSVSVVVGCRLSVEERRGEAVLELAVGLGLIGGHFGKGIGKKSRHSVKRRRRRKFTNTNQAREREGGCNMDAVRLLGDEKYRSRPYQPYQQDGILQSSFDLLSAYSAAYSHPSSFAAPRDAARTTGRKQQSTVKALVKQLLKPELHVLGAGRVSTGNMVERKSIFESSWRTGENW
jgi:hypothetical protein